MTLAWKSIECPRCGSPPGKPCLSARGRIVTTHVLRHQRAAEDLRADMIKEQKRYEPIPIQTAHLPGD